MHKPHKHAEVIKAWADGKEIQWKREIDSVWSDYKYCPDHGIPSFSYYEWRVKPDPLWFRVALYEDNSVYAVYNCENDELRIEKCSYFVRWLTGRIEYEGV